jgi:REP element-mobilizing transposase RayT
VAAILVSAWTTPPETYGWLVGRYVVMPDHVHFFAATCRDDAKDLSRFVGGWKRWTAGLIRQQVDRGFGWQREFFDHLLRSSESYGAKWEYVRQNPVRAGLVPTPDAWPYQGEIFPLAW